MSAVIVPTEFGSPNAVRKARAANLAYVRAQDMGYCRAACQALARTAKRESHDWESPLETALRVVRPMHATMHPHRPTGGTAA